MEKQNIIFLELSEFKEVEKTGLTYINLNLSQSSTIKYNIDILSNELSKCSEIETLILDLQGQYLQDPHLMALFENLPQFINLSTFQINLIQNNIQKYGANILGQFLRKCQKLTNIKLDFFFNSADSSVFTELIEAIGSIKGIQYLEMMFGNNDTKDDITFHLSKSLCNLSNQLISLVIGLSENQIGFEGGNQIGRALSNQQNLKNLELWLYKNQIGDKGVTCIAAGLTNCTQLTSLVFNLYKNGIGDEGSHQIGLALGKCQNLKELELYLSKNQISDIGLQSIALGLRNCILVTKVLISFNENKIGDIGVLAISQALAFYRNILHLELWLQINQISDQGMLGLTQNLKYCTQLKQLTFNLNENNITDEGYKTLDLCLESLPKLYSLECWFQQQKDILNVLIYQYLLYVQSNNFSSSEKILKSKEILSCMNIKVLTLNTSQSIICSHSYETSSFQSNFLRSLSINVAFAQKIVFKKLLITHALFDQIPKLQYEKSEPFIYKAQFHNFTGIKSAIIILKNSIFSIKSGFSINQLICRSTPIIKITIYDFQQCDFFLLMALIPKAKDLRY
ncbi:hypothetical protein ABPG74_020031 [Tetrahymena malaccensis]